MVGDQLGSSAVTKEVDEGMSEISKKNVITEYHEKLKEGIETAGATDENGTWKDVTEEMKTLGELVNLCCNKVFHIYL